MVGLAGKPACPGNDWWSAVLGPSAPLQEFKTTLEILADRGIYPSREATHSTRNRYLFHCPLPGHEHDQHPSFSVHSDGIRWNCFVCGIGGGPTKLALLLDGVDSIPRMPQVSPPPIKAVKKEKDRPSGCTLRQLSQAKPLPLDYLKSEMGWFDTDWFGIPSIGIRYPNGILRYRVGLTGDRFRWQKGPSPDLYGRDWLQPTDEILLYCEGETDVAAGRLMGIPTVGIPGVDTWQPEWAKYSEGRTPYLWQEPGKAGQTLADKMIQDIPGLRVIDAELAGHKDLCKLLAAFDGDIAGTRSYLDGLIEDAEPVNPPSPDRDVPNRERVNKSSFPIRDIRFKSQLWEAAQAYFPVHGKPWTVARAMYNHTDGKGLVAEFPSNSWKNPANAQLKRQRLFFNMLPRMNGPQLYLLKVPCDDWTDKAHEAVKKRIRRAILKAGDEADYGWCWFDNAVSRGYVLYLTSAPGVSGFAAVEDVEATLVAALKAIHPPRDEEPGRFRPYGGSTNWTARVEGTGERDRDRWNVVAVSDSPADYVQVEAECVASGIHYEYTKQYWRQQIGMGLEVDMSFEEFLGLCTSLGYSPTRAGRAGLVVTDEATGDHR